MDWDCVRHARWHRLCHSPMKVSYESESSWNDKIIQVNQGFNWFNWFNDNLGVAPFPVTVSTRIVLFLVGDPYKPSFTTVTVRGPHPNDNFSFWLSLAQQSLFVFIIYVTNLPLSKLFANGPSIWSHGGDSQRAAVSRDSQPLQTEGEQKKIITNWR